MDINDQENYEEIYFLLHRIPLKSKSIRLFNFPNSDNELDSEIKIKTLFPIKALFIEVSFIFFKFLGFFILLNINNSINTNSFLFIFVIFCLSWSIGLIVPAAPGGIGIFEACFLVFIGKDFSQGSIIVSLIYFRFISTIADLFLSAPFLLNKFIKRN